MRAPQAGLQLGAASQPQLGAASQPQLGAASQPQLGAAAHPQLGAGAAHGAGAAQQLGAGAAHGAGASHPQLGAASQQLFLQLNLLMMPLILHPRFSFGLQTGAESQQLGAGASQHAGAESQQAFFLQNKPAEAFEDEIAPQTTTVKVMINRRMDFSPKQSFYKPRRELLGCHDYTSHDPVPSFLDGS